MKSTRRFPALPLALVLFLFARIPILLALPFDGLRGYGDLLHFYNLASIPGLPFINFWIEFPPGFAFLNEFIYVLAGGVEHTFTYLFVGLLLAADIGNVLLFCEIEKELYPAESAPTWRSLIYAVLLAGLPYAWWYFDSLVVFFSMLTLYLIIKKRNPILAGAALGAGILAKFFPILMIPALLRSLNLRRSITIALVAIGMLLAPVLVLFAISPIFTRASLESQSMRGSTATIWALVDGNYLAGGFGPLVERLDPSKATQTFRNPAVISQYLLLGIFGAAGLYLFLKSHLDTLRKTVAFYGLTLVIFFIWSSAWSPQWILHLIPVALLVLPYSPGLLIVTVLILANLLEWPLLLSRGMFFTYPVTILLRLFIMILLGYSFFQEMQPATNVKEIPLAEKIE
jgi:hypothetical protein